MENKLQALIIHLLKHALHYLFGMLALIVIIGFGLMFYGAMYKLSDIIAYFGFTGTIFVVFFGLLQFKSKRDWDKRQLAIIVSKEIKHKSIDDVFVLTKAFNYIELSSTDVIDVDDIHDKICRKDEKGELYRDPKDGKLRIDQEGDGHKVKRAIYNTLNDYEYIAVGIYQKVFEKEIIRVLSGGPIIRAYNNFSAYIKHYNEDMAQDRNNKIWMNFKNLAIEFMEAEKTPPDKRKETGL